jgi:hypothetical protein
VILEKTHTVLESHTSKVSTNEVWSNGIIFMKLKDNVQIEYEDSVNQFEFLKARAFGEHSCLVLVEAGRYTGISKEAREFSTQPEVNRYTKATAVVVKSLAHRILINFIINFTKQQTMKMRMFDDKEKAIQWLLAFKTNL